MSKRSLMWRARMGFFRPRAEPSGPAEKHLRQLENVVNAFVPKSAILVKHVGQCIHYLHPRKGWRDIAARRLRGAQVLIPQEA